MSKYEVNEGNLCKKISSKLKINTSYTRKGGAAYTGENSSDIE